MSESLTKKLQQYREKISRGRLDKHGEKLEENHKLFVRDRLQLLLDEDSFQEDGLFANVNSEGLPADGVVTGIGRINGRPICVMANDSTVKAGSWGKHTVEKLFGFKKQRYG